MDSRVTNHMVIRADCDARLGTGHVMRCLALACEWKNNGGCVTFLSYCGSETLRVWIKANGFDLELLTQPYPDSSDMPLTLSILKERREASGESWLVLDGYHFDSVYQGAIKDAGFKLLVVDDTAHLPFYSADVILNQNVHANELVYTALSRS